MGTYISTDFIYMDYGPELRVFSYEYATFFLEVPFFSHILLLTFAKFPLNILFIFMMQLGFVIEF